MCLEKQLEQLHASIQPLRRPNQGYAHARVHVPVRVRVMTPARKSYQETSRAWLRCRILLDTSGAKAITWVSKHVTNVVVVFDLVRFAEP